MTDLTDKPILRAVKTTREALEIFSAWEYIFDLLPEWLKEPRYVAARDEAYNALMVAFAKLNREMGIRDKEAGLATPDAKDET